MSRSTSIPRAGSSGWPSARRPKVGMRSRARWCPPCPTCIRTRSSARSPAAPAADPPAQDDSFWTWRQAMYAFLDQVDADSFEAIAAQAYVEMTKAGYAAVGEFHYVHHDAAGKPYADPAELAWRIVSAAQTRRPRPDAAAGVLRARGLRRHADDGGAAPVRAHAVHVHASRRSPARARGRRSLRARRRAAQPARGDAGGTGTGGAARRRPGRPSTSMRPSRRAKSTTASRGAGCGRWNGC